MVRKLILAALLIFTVSAARAQEPIIFGAPNQGPITAGQLYNGTLNGPVTASFTFFTTTFEAVNTPMKAAVAGIIGSLIDWVKPLMLTSGILICIVAILAVIASDGVSANIPTSIILPIVVRTTILIWLLGGVGIFAQYISDPLLQLPMSLSNAVLNNVGGAAPQGGSPFDLIWSHAFAACLKAGKAVQWWTIEGLAAGIVVFAVACLSYACTGLIFAVYLVNYMLLSLIVAVSPIFVAALLSRYTRNFFGGWLSAAVAAIVTLLLLNVMLAVLIKVMQTSIDLVMNAAPTANSMGMIASIFGIVTLLIICVYLAWRIESVSVGIASGVMIEANKAVAAGADYAASGMSTVGGWTAAKGSSGAGGGSAAAASASFGTGAASAPVGRSLSGSSSPPSGPPT